jgi:hypothetical protein
VSQQNEEPKKKCPAAESAARALSEQAIAEKINLEGQQEQFNEVLQELLHDKAWMQQAQGAANIMEQEIRATKTLVILRHMATFYKVGFEAGRAYERSLSSEPVVH